MQLSPALKRGLLYAPLLLLGAQSVWAFLWVTTQRLDYPYELEWMEGGVLQQVLQLLHGKPLYGQPSLVFVSALYMPLYYYVAAGFAKVVGVNFFALRLVSWLASLLTHGLVFLIVSKQARSTWAGVLGVFFYTYMFQHTAFWFDVARVDCLWTFFLAFATYVLLRCRDNPSRSSIFLLAVLSVLAFFTKQATLFLLPFVVVAMVCWCGWRQLMDLLVLCVLLAVPGFVFLHYVVGEDWYFYTMQMAGTHGVTAFGAKRFFEIVLHAIPAMLCASAIFLVFVQGSSRERCGWFALVAGFVFVSLLSRAYAGAFFNVLMPLYFCVACVSAIGFSLLVERAVQVHDKPATYMMLLAVVLTGLLAADFYRSAYRPERQLPTANGRSNTEWLIAKIAAVQGPVCVTSHGYLAWLAGKDFCAHNTQVSDLVTGSSQARADILLANARQKIMSGYYAAIVLDREKDLLDLGLTLQDIPYRAEPLRYPEGEITFAVNGRSPRIWLQYTGAISTSAQPVIQ